MCTEVFFWWSKINIKRIVWRANNCRKNIKILWSNNWDLSGQTLVCISTFSDKWNWKFWSYPFFYYYYYTCSKCTFSHKTCELCTIYFCIQCSGRVRVHKYELYTTIFGKKMKEEYPCSACRLEKEFLIFLLKNFKTILRKKLHKNTKLRFLFADIT